MIAVIAMLSDIPYYIAEIISKLTGADASAFLDAFSNIFSKVIELAGKLLG